MKLWLVIALLLLVGCASVRGPEPLVCAQPALGAAYACAQVALWAPIPGRN